MNKILKNILLNVLTLSALTITAVQVTGCSSNDGEVYYEFDEAKRNAPAGENTAGVENSAALPLANIDFDVTHHNFGTIKEGEKVEHKFVFKNTGNEVLQLENVQPACGCTVPSFSREPIEPGGTGEIAFAFDSQGRPGLNHKYITVIANIPEESVRLTFEVMVE